MGRALGADWRTRVDWGYNVRVHQSDTAGAHAYRLHRRQHWDEVARGLDWQHGAGTAYHDRLIEVYRSLVAPGQRIVELGCGRGDLLAALRPSVGLGVDFSQKMTGEAARRHPDLHFVTADAHDLPLRGTFDVVVVSDLVNDLWDVQRAFEQVASVTTPQTRIILNTYSRLWEPPLDVTRRLGLAQPNLRQNWLTVGDLVGLGYLADLEVIRSWEEILWPLPTPILGGVLNKLLVRFPPFRYFALTNFVVARPQPRMRELAQEPLVSVIVPARNEAGNIAQIFARTPELGRGTELVFVEGHSRDDTYAAIEREIAAHPERRAQLHRQTGVGKGDAVRLGFAKASGDILMILDADLTVPPEDLPRFYEVLRSGKADLANGVRLVYPMENQAMRFFNLVGNKAFSLAFSWLLGQSLKDTLCGTKVMWRRTYELIAANRSYFGDFDPFGDFDLILGAARLNLKIVDVPIRYRERTYGTTNIQRWRHGLILLRMLVFAARRLKFV